MPPVRSRLALSCCLALGLLAGASLPATNATPARPGCSATRVASAYDRTGHRLALQPAGAPVPCLAYTGYATVETHIAVTRDGAVVDQPAVVTPGLLGSAFVPGAPGPHPWQPTSPAGLAVTHDGGASWDFVKPAGSYAVSTDAGLYADPVTGRLFEETLSPGQVPSGGQLALPDQTPGGHAILLTSPDDGRTWDYTALTGFVFQENARFASAPPAAGQATPAGGYPDVTYWCGNRVVGLMEPLILERECYRSLDAGGTWTMRSILLTSPVPQHAECGLDREDVNSYDGSYPQGAPDGSLYLIVSCTPPTNPTGHGGTVYLARSADEAATFPILRSGGAPVTLPVPAGADWPELRVGGGALFLTYAHGAQIFERSTRVPTFTATGALAAPLVWGPPILLSRPGMVSIDEWAVAARGPEVAASYVGQTVAGSYDGYISVTTDARAAHPVVWTSTVNDPAQPLMKSAPVQAKDDFIDVSVGPDGRPWAGFFSPCSVEPPDAAIKDPACEGAYFGGQPIAIEGGNDRGVVGSLLFG
jgi:hypothetical protein